MVGDIIFKGFWVCKLEMLGNNINKLYYGNVDIIFELLNYLFDYCNDLSVLWLIIEKYRIFILDQLIEWCVDVKGVSLIFDIRFFCVVMIVFFMMQDVNNVQFILIFLILERKC